MRARLPYSLIVSLFLGLCPALSPGQEAGISPKHHPWGCFEVGAWTYVRVVTQTFEETGTLTSITERKTTLKELTEDGATLLVESVVEVGGKRLRADPQTIKQGWHGELLNQDVKITHLGSGEVVIRRVRIPGKIEELVIPCEIEQLVVTGPASKTTTKIYYSDAVEPFILRRESITTDLEGTTRLGETTVEVMDVDVPCRILASIRNTFHVRAVHKNAKGTTMTNAFTSTRVPGGVIRNDSKEFDKSGRLVRQSSLELLNYGLEMEEESTGPRGPWRPGRPSRPPWPPRFPPHRLHLPPHTRH